MCILMHVAHTLFISVSVNILSFFILGKKMIPCGPASPCVLCNTVCLADGRLCDLPVHFDALWLWEENANEQHRACKVLLLSLQK